MLTTTEKAVERQRAAERFLAAMAEEETSRAWRGDLWFGEGWDEEEEELTGRVHKLTEFRSQAECDRGLGDWLVKAARRYGSGFAALVDGEGRLLSLMRVEKRHTRRAG